MILRDVTLRSQLSLLLFSIRTFIADAMPVWLNRRSRSRTTTPPRRRGAAGSSRPSTSTHQPAQTSTSVPRGTSGHQPPWWNSPTRHVLVIINFQDLADLSTRLSSPPDNIDYLDAECRSYLGTVDEISLFTWCRHFEPNELSQVSIRHLCYQISTRIQDTWNIQIPGHTLELRGTAEDDDTVQISDELSIGEALEAWFPRWQTLQQTSFRPRPLPHNPRRPFVWRTSCHRKVPGVILP